MKVKCMGCMKDYDNEENEQCPYCGYSLKDEIKNPRFLAPRTKIASRYVIGKVLGSGGFGITYLGWDDLLQVRIAIKEFFPKDFCERGDENIVYSVQAQQGDYYQKGLSSFMEEARRLAAFNELEGVVTVHNIVEENGTSYIIMEYLEGESLEERLRKVGKMSCKEAVKLLMPAMKSLSTMHKSGMIHRDIAPDNIFITTKEKVKLLDFGAARFETTNLHKELTIIIKGGYSPQEQYNGNMEQGSYTDVYALAATMYRMITGRKLESAFARKGNIGTLRGYDANITINEETAIRNALKLSPWERTQTVKAFIEELTREEELDERTKKADIEELGKDNFVYAGNYNPNNNVYDNNAGNYNPNNNVYDNNAGNYNPNNNVYNNRYEKNNNGYENNKPVDIKERIRINKEKARQNRPNNKNRQNMSNDVGNYANNRNNNYANNSNNRNNNYINNGNNNYANNNGSNYINNNGNNNWSNNRNNNSNNNWSNNRQVNSRPNSNSNNQKNKRHKKGLLTRFIEYFLKYLIKKIIKIIVFVTFAVIVYNVIVNGIGYNIVEIISNIVNIFL